MKQQTVIILNDAMICVGESQIPPKGYRFIDGMSGDGGKSWIHTCEKEGNNVKYGSALKTPRVVRIDLP